MDRRSEHGYLHEAVRGVALMTGLAVAVAIVATIIAATLSFVVG